MNKRAGAKSSKKPKQPELNRGNLGFSLGSYTTPSYDYPIFCLKHLVSGYTVGECSKELKGLFAAKLHFMAQQTWQGLENGYYKSGAGFEMLPKKQMKANLPSIITEDVDKLHVIRFNGNTGRIIGLKSDGVFHITHIETDKSAYNHGS